MRVTDILRDIGRPVAYYPGLARFLGGVKATVLFCQIFYWQDKSTSDLGVHKTTEELLAETGLSYEEQRAARKALKAAGVLIETEKRIEHKIYFRIDEDALERLVTRAEDEPEGADPEMGKVQSPKLEKSISRNGKSPFREMGKVQSAKWSNPRPRTGQTLPREMGKVQVVNGVKTTAEITAESSSNAREDPAVDNSAAAADEEKPNVKTASALGELLVGLEAARGKQLTIDPTKDRIHLLTWLGKGVTAEQLRMAHALAVAARGRDADERPTYVGFVTQFIAEAQGASAPAVIPSDWYENGSDIEAKGKELGVRPRKPDEPMPFYRVLVARAAGKGPWIDYVLRDAQRSGSEQYFKFVVDTFGEALLPADFYAS